MSNKNIASPGNFLRNTRTFPLDPQELSVELSRTYVDIANMVNSRTSGIFGLDSQVVTSEQWILTGGATKQFTLRDVFTFSDANLIFNHNIDLTGILYFTRIYGAFFDGIYWNPLPYVDVVSATNQIKAKVSATQVIITKGGGSPPAISNGLVVIEWMNQN